MSVDSGTVYMQGESEDATLVAQLEQAGFSLCCQGLDAEVEALAAADPIAVLVVANELEMPHLELVSRWVNASPVSYIAAICDHCERDVRQAFFQFGGTDIILQPYLIDELLAKLGINNKMRERFKRGELEVQQATEMAMTAMSASSDLGLIIEFLKNTFDIEDYDGVAAYLINAVSIYSSHVAVLIETDQGHHFFSNVSDRDGYQQRLLQYRDQARLVAEDDWVQINQQHLSILIDQLELATEDQLGRFKDTMQMLAESAELCVRNLMNMVLAAKAVESRTLFLSTMSHEFRTPLNSIQGFARLFRNRQQGEPLTHKDLKALDAIGRNAVALSQLVNTTLDVAAACAGKLELNPAIVPVQALLEEVGGRVSDYAKDRRVAVDIAPCAEDWRLAIDRERLREVLVHLLTNAVKFNRPDGTARLYVEQTVVEGKNWLEFHIEDNGLGISQDHQNMLLYTFGQIDESLDRTYEGIGLGLRFAFLIAQLCDGDLSFTSVEFEGSHFILRLPQSAG